jgi:hypothetical protein
MYNVSGWIISPGTIESVAFTLSVRESVSGKGGPHAFWAFRPGENASRVISIYIFFI